MSDDPLGLLDHAIESVTKLRKAIGRNNSVQVTGQDECALVKATALTWIRQQRVHLGEGTPPARLLAIDDAFTSLLEFSDRRITRDRYKTTLKRLRADLVAFRSNVVSDPSIAETPASSAVAPDWSVLVSDPNMQFILTRRWQETAKCLDAGAHLAATVMMGSLLEALLLSRVNKEQDKSRLFRFKSAPIDKSTGKAALLQKWTLQHFIDVAHEAGWIRQSARDVSIVLRDYRNYIHPAKELSHGVRVNSDDSAMFWVVFQSLAEQILKSAKVI